MSWSDGPSNTKIVEAGIEAIAVFRRDIFLPVKAGFESPVHRCVFVNRAELPHAWPIGQNGKPLELIGVEVNLEAYEGKEIRLATTHNSTGSKGVLRYKDWAGFFMESDERTFGVENIVSASLFGETRDKTILKLVVKL